ncbi:MAG TPA: beta-galactosidase [Verrucomicrobiae bacterium]|nr:beta-galactosidase [Verrucomicrobiae bacterium]
MNRREFTKRLCADALGAWALKCWGLNALAAASATTDPLFSHGAFIVRGKPVFLVSGSIDYFRCPPELWPDRLLKAKRGGLNCIASCIMWNFHEVEEGRFTFSGEHDLGRFIDLCGELGLYFYARVGPFVCDEWDGGGHPAWLIAKEDIEFRAQHAPTLKYVRRWFEHLIPILAQRQVTRGGPVILVQQENEYHYSNRPDGRAYQSTLVRWMRELGIDVTISDCNLSEARIEGSLQTINGFNLDRARQLQRKRPGLPVLVSELYTGYLECWGQSAVPCPVEPLRRQLMELLAERVMWNYFMYHGGTNFGFGASSSWKTDDAFVTTYYYENSPLAEGGAFNESFLASKSIDQLATNFQEFFAQSAPTRAPLQSGGNFRLSALASPQGTMVFLLPDKNAGQEAADLVLPAGQKIELAEAACTPMMLPYGFSAAPDCRIDWANATLLGVAGSKAKPALVFYGREGRHGHASMNGQVVEFGFGTREPEIREVGSTLVLGISPSLLVRTWFADGRLIVGPAYAGERHSRQHECWFAPGKNPVHVVESDGRHHRQLVHTPEHSDDKVMLSDWRAFPFPEISGGGKDWRALNPPQSLEQLGVYEGYAWYRAKCHSDTARSTTLQFTRAADRFHVFLNGKPCGVWGRGAGATRDPLPVELVVGENDFIFLCDNMGHSSEGRAKERKGILGPVALDARTVPLGPGERFMPSGPPSTNFEFETYRALSAGAGRWAGFAWNLTVQPGERLLFTLRGIPQYGWLCVNGRVVGEHGGDFSLVNGFSYKEFLLSEDLGTGSVRIELVLFGNELANPEEHVRLFAYPKEKEVARWWFKPWTTPRHAARLEPGVPTWWECELPAPKIPGPVFLHLAGVSKGQVWLNGRAAGHYWEIGPQKTLYLPEPWWEHHNYLAVFDEEGREPKQLFLGRDSRVPKHSILI